MTSPRLLSVNVGLPRTVEFHGRKIRTGIFKEPVLFPVHVGKLDLDGDRQADLTVHGGPDKAVYAYDLSGYTHWRRALSRELPFGQFGENLTVEGMPETEVRIGDTYRIGSTLFQVSQPRSPCFKLAMKMEMPTFPRMFLAAGRTGFYFRVLEEGEVEAGDAITLVSREPGQITVLEATREIYGG